MATKRNQESAQWLGPIVTKTLNNENLITTDTSKELDFYFGSKYITFLKVNTHQKLRTWENFVHFSAKKGEAPSDLKWVNTKWVKWS